MKIVHGVVLAMFVGSAAFAHSGATGIVKERMDMMKDLGATMKALVLQSKAHTVEQQVVLDARKTIIGHADHLVGMFPKGSNERPSEASPAIWVERDKFDELFREMRSAAIDLSRAPDAKPLSEQVAAITAACKACHQQFRVKR